MATELFIYYRVRDTAAAHALAAVREMQTRLRTEFPRLDARVMRRPETDNGLQTWMETYAIEGGVDDALRQRIAAHAQDLLQHLIEGERHAEGFAPFGDNSACA